jgi:hypothetical protein
MITHPVNYDGLAGRQASPGSPNMYFHVAEPHHFYATPPPDRNFDAAPSPFMIEIDIALGKV